MYVDREQLISATFGTNLKRSFLNSLLLHFSLLPFLSLFSERRIVVAKLYETRLVLHIKDSMLMASPNFSRTAQ